MNEAAALVIVVGVIWLSVLTLGLIMIYNRLGFMLDIIADTKKNTTDIKLQTHTRQQRAAMVSGKPSRERVLKGVGRATSNRRSVVGGDPASPLYESLGGDEQREGSHGE